MRMYAFGQKDTIVVHKPAHIGNALGAAISYTEPTLDVFYSKHGFAIPLDYEGVPLEMLVTGKVPNFFHAQLKPVERTLSYLMVKQDGSVWTVIANIKSEAQQFMEGISYSSSYVYTKTEGWWMTMAFGEVCDEDYQMVLGLLKANPSKKLIEKYFKEHLNNTKLMYLNIPAIIARHKELFPPRKVEELTNDLRPEKGM